MYNSIRIWQLLELGTSRPIRLLVFIRYALKFDWVSEKIECDYAQAPGSNLFPYRNGGLAFLKKEVDILLRRSQSTYQDIVEGSWDRLNSVIMSMMPRTFSLQLWHHLISVCRDSYLVQEIHILPSCKGCHSLVYSGCDLLWNSQ